MPCKTARGYSLSELLVVIAIIGILALTAVAALSTIMRRMAVSLAAAEIISAMVDARSRAESLEQNCGVRFQYANGVWSYASYMDGDRDGVLNTDIAAGIDRLVAAPRILASLGTPLRIGLPSRPIADPDDDSVIAPESSPVRFNGSSICSFSWSGTATPGTVFVTDGSEVAAVRVQGTTAMIRMLRYERFSGKWSE